MELILRVLGAEAVGESRSLLNWLRVDDVPGLRVSTANDALRLVFEPALATAVAGAVATWLTTRRRAVEVQLRHGNWELTLGAGNPSDARKLLGEIEGLLVRPEPAGE